MKILFAIDQSKDSKVAINLLQKLKWPAGSILLLLHVTTVDDEITPMGSSRLSKKKSSDSGKQSLAVHPELRRLEKQFASEMLQVQTMVVNGIPGQEILNVIRKKKIDVVDPWFVQRRYSCVSFLFDFGLWCLFKENRYNNLLQ